MSRFSALFLAFCIVALPTQALAAEKSGVYVAPKFIYGIQSFKMKGTGVDNESDGTTTSFSDALGSHNKGVAGGALALGYDFNSKFSLPIRTELEYSVFGDAKGSHTNYNDEPDGIIEDKNTGKVGIQSLFVNVYYDFHNESKFTPYVGGGIGLGFVSTKGSGELTGDPKISIGRKTNTNFAWNLGLGCAYEFTDYFALDLGYRYANFGKGETKTYSDEVGTFKIKTNNVGMHQFVLSARFTF